MVNGKKESDYVFTCKCNDDFECANYNKKAVVPDDESEERHETLWRRRRKYRINVSILEF